MLRLLKLGILGIIGIVLIALALSNNEMVRLSLWPDAPLGGLLGQSAPTVTLPVWAIILASVALGLFIGFLWEWLREASQRRQAENMRREGVRLKREVETLKQERNEGKDDILALLEDAR